MSGDKKDLTVAQLSSILKVCRKLCITKLSFHNMIVEFDPEANLYSSVKKARKVSPARIAEVEEEELSRQELLVRQSQHEQMIIDDPQGYEKLLTEGELGDAKAEYSGSEQEVLRI